MEVECYFDESGTGNEAVNLCVAGYIIEKEQALILNERWNKVLEEYGLPFFHMVDCAHNAWPFDHLTKNQCVQVQMKMMKLIKQHTINGVVATINKPDTKFCMPPQFRHLDAYTLMALLAIDEVQLWMHLTGFEGRATYFFEAGADGQGQANNAINELFQLKERRDHAAYAGHAFLPKRGNPCLQAADLLAWQFYNFTKKSIDQKAPRLDFRALMRHPHIVKHVGAKEMLSKGIKLGYDITLTEQQFQDVVDQSGQDYPITVQSVAESRVFKESVFYLPRVKPTPNDATLMMDKDVPTFKGVDRNLHLACPSCFRVIAYDTHPLSIWKNFSPESGVLNILCICRTLCGVPEILPPFIR
jgi:hypothetical protein